MKTVRVVQPTLAVLKCLQFFVVFLDAVQCILIVHNTVKCIWRPLSILHNSCHSMCVQFYTDYDVSVKLLF